MIFKRKYDPQACLEDAGFYSLSQEIINVCKSNQTEIAEISSKLYYIERKCDNLFLEKHVNRDKYDDLYELTRSKYSKLRSFQANLDTLIRVFEKSTVKSIRDSIENSNGRIQKQSKDLLKALTKGDSINYATRVLDDAYQITSQLTLFSQDIEELDVRIINLDPSIEE